MEYVSRFLVHTYVPYDGKLDVEEFIDEGSRNARYGKRNAASRRDLQCDPSTCSTKRSAGTRYGVFRTGAPTGRVGLAAFEGKVRIGIAKNIANIQATKQTQGDYVRQRVNEFW